jgi:hypothetical protein
MSFMKKINMPVRPPGDGIKINVFALIKFFRLLRKFIKQWRRNHVLLEKTKYGK